MELDTSGILWLALRARKPIVMRRKQTWRLPEGPQRGTGFGAMATVNGIGDFISSLSVGWLWAAQGPRVGFGFACGVMALGTLLILRRGWRLM